MRTGVIAISMVLLLAISAFTVAPALAREHQHRHIEHKCFRHMHELFHGFVSDYMMCCIHVGKPHVFVKFPGDEYNFTILHIMFDALVLFDDMDNDNVMDFQEIRSILKLSLLDWSSQVYNITDEQGGIIGLGVNLTGKYEGPKIPGHHRIFSCEIELRVRMYEINYTETVTAENGEYTYVIPALSAVKIDVIVKGWPFGELGEYITLTKPMLGVWMDLTTLCMKRKTYRIIQNHTINIIDIERDTPMQYIVLTEKAKLVSGDHSELIDVYYTVLGGEEGVFASIIMCYPEFSVNDTLIHDPVIGNNVEYTPAKITLASYSIDHSAIYYGEHVTLTAKVQVHDGDLQTVIFTVEKPSGALVNVTASITWDGESYICTATWTDTSEIGEYTWLSLTAITVNGYSKTIQIGETFTVHEKTASPEIPSIEVDNMLITAMSLAIVALIIAAVLVIKFTEKR